MCKVIILGNGGHAKVVTEVILSQGYEIIGYTCPREESNPYNLKYLGDDLEILRYSPEDILLVNGIGSTTSLNLRSEIFLSFKERGYNFLTIIHNDAIISSYSEIGEGVQVLAGSVIQPFAKIGNNTIINTSSSIDHDSYIDNHCHIAPGTTISGEVEIGEKTHIGVGSTILQGIHIGKESLIGSGSLVNKNIGSNVKAYGIPVKEVSK